MKLSIILPSYKEADNLKKIIPRIQAVVKGILITSEYEILVIDTTQPMDDTPLICETMNVRYIPRKFGNSYGDAIRTGILDANGKYILVMDADGSHDPADIVRLYHYMQQNESDIIIGSRYIEGGKTSNGFVSIMMSYAVNLTYSKLFGLSIKDVSNSFRIYRTDLLKNIQLQCNNFDVVEEILIKIYRKFPSVKIAEVPIFFHKRDEGHSKRNLLRFIVSYIVSIIRLFKIRNNY